MRFQTGKGWPYSRRSRGPGRGEYRMSRATYQARLRNLVGWNRARTFEQTRRIEVEIALAVHRGETFVQQRNGWAFARTPIAGGSHASTALV